MLPRFGFPRTHHACASRNSRRFAITIFTSANAVPQWAACIPIISRAAWTPLRNAPSKVAGSPVSV
jgi:hypothetical protein